MHDHPSRGLITRALWPLRVRRLQLKRFSLEFFRDIPKLGLNEEQGPLVTAAESITPIYRAEDLAERALELGKAQNLRIAAQKLDRRLLPAHTIFSFWKQLGVPSGRNGFVPGRELREGCLVPSIGGGLCQLSNALYDCALKVQATIVERHAHSRVIPGSLAEQNRDATIFWNYIDLRFSHHTAIVFSVHLSEKDLIVKFLVPPSSPIAESSEAIRGSGLRVLLEESDHSCMTCEQHECSTHNSKLAVKLRSTLTAIKPSKRAFIVDTLWPEYFKYIEQHARTNDIFSIPDAWRGMLPASVRRGVITAPLQSLTRSLAVRLSAWPHYSAPKLREANLRHESLIANALAKQVPWVCDELVVSQAYLPWLWKSGFLGARKFQVLMTRYPMRTLHKLLDRAAARSPNFQELRDFRAPQALVELEEEALASAERIVTPHADLAALYGERAQKLDWVVPVLRHGSSDPSTKPRNQAQESDEPKPLAFFPSPPHARKGVAIIRVLAEVGAESLIVLARNRKEREFWSDLPVEVVDTNSQGFARAAKVLSPTIVEDRPAILLAALAHGLPVETTRESGLEGTPGVRILDFASS